jgi:phage shock protein A
MSETLRTRVGRIIAGSVHAILDKVEDQAPEAMMEQAAREIDQVATDVRAELGKAAANRHLAQAQHAELNSRHLELAGQIEQAIVGKREELARAAVARQLDIEAQIPVLENTLAELSNQETELKGYLDALLAKRREMQDAVSQYRASRDKAQSAASAAAGSRTDGRVDNATSAFDRIYARQTGLTPAAHGATMEQAAKLKELDDLVRNNKIEERLAKLRAMKEGGGEASK